MTTPKLNLIQMPNKRQYLVMSEDRSRLSVCNYSFKCYSGVLDNSYVNDVQPEYYTSFWKALWEVVLYGGSVGFVDTKEAEDYDGPTGEDSYSWLRLKADPTGKLYKVYRTPIGNKVKDHYVYTTGGDELCVKLHTEGTYLLSEFEEIIL